jgi:hypothetical protein
MRLGRFVFACLLTVALAACAANRVKTDLTYEGTYRSYEQFVDTWTRTGKIYHYFGTQAIVSATYFSLPMRRAFASEWGRAYDLPMEEREKVLAEQIDHARKRVEFVVSFYTPKERFNDLDEPDSSWRLWLIDAQGVKVEASKIERLRIRHKKEYLFFPSYTEWSRLYRVYFPAVGPDGRPLVTESGAVTLRVTGVEGMADLAWEITPGAH